MSSQTASRPPVIATVLGVESSCDETSASVVRAEIAADGALTGGDVLSNVVWGQTELHDRFGGVVPEIAARAHAERLEPVVRQALRDAAVALEALDAVAATAGPGLIGGVAAGLAMAQGLCVGSGRPLLAVNHLEGHALSPRLVEPLAFPYLLLLVSGGHCLLIDVAGPGRHRRLGGSIDDSPGEAFDKLAKHLGLGFPGGPAVERAAASGDPARFGLPRPLLGRPGADMSFSGLKTAARLAADALAQEKGGLTDQDVADLCAGFQAAVRDVLVAKTEAAAAALDAPPKRIAVAGGVAANQSLRHGLKRSAERLGADFVAPPLWLCTDNAAMIAWAGLERIAAAWSRGAEPPDEALTAHARPRWPLDPGAAPLIGSGRKGAKA